MLLLGVHCRGTDEATRSAPPPEPPPPPPGLEFETKQDTVLALDTQIPAPSADTRIPQIRYMVQIGAFKDPKLASGVQTVARDRFHLPVLNDYNTQLELYQVRIGFFETYESAAEFRRKLQTEFPPDYKDSWIVQLKN